jgi:alkyl hydroperoxide reductase subunit AhpC
MCTTEFITFASMQQQLRDYNTELVRLSVDGLNSHIAWLRTITEKITFNGMSGVEVTFPLIADITMEVAKKYGMIMTGEGPASTVALSPPTTEAVTTSTTVVTPVATIPAVFAAAPAPPSADAHRPA